MSNAKTDPRHDFIPAREGELLPWARNYRDAIVLDPVSFGLDSGQAAHLSDLFDVFAARFTEASSPATNSKSTIVAKNEAKAALKANARMLARIIRANPAITNEQRARLGLTVPVENLVPIARPGHAPVLTVLPSTGRVVRIRLRDKASPDRLGKPPGVAGAAVMTYTARSPEETSPPTDLSNWSYHGNATRRTFDVNLGSDVPAGAKVWITAAWYSTRGKFGPASTAQSIIAQAGVAKLRMAA